MLRSSLWSAGLVLLGMVLGEAARSQETVPLAADAAAPATPVAPVELGDVVQPAQIPEPTLWPPPALVENQPERSFLGLVWESNFGDAYAKPSTWRPLPLSTFFTEGWDEPFVAPPAGSGGAPRSGWINSFEGVLFRTWLIVSSFSENVRDDRTQVGGSFILYTPINRRSQLRIEIPLAVNDRGNPRNDFHGHGGDLTLTPRFLLSETKDFSQTVVCAVRIPTGDTTDGNGVTSLTPQYQFWWNATGKWVVRGGTGVRVPTNTVDARTNYHASLAVGRYMRPHDAPFLPDLTLYVCSNMNTTLDNRGPNETYCALTPGMRVNLTGMWYFLAGVEFPVTSTRVFHNQPIFALLKNY